MSALNVNTINGVDVQNLASKVARAWVNFNGTGVVAIRKAFNVASITDNGVGDYIVNFTTPMPDASYCTLAGCSVSTATAYAPTIARANVLVGSVRIQQLGSSNGPAVATDWDNCNIAVFD